MTNKEKQTVYYRPKTMLMDHEDTRVDLSKWWDILDEEDWFNNTKNHLKEFKHEFSMQEFWNYFLTITGACEKIKDFEKAYDEYQKDLTEHMAKQENSDSEQPVKKLPRISLGSRSFLDRQKL